MENNREIARSAWEAAGLMAERLASHCRMPDPKTLWTIYPGVIRGGRFATFCVLFTAAVSGGCAGTTSSHCDEGAECAQREAEPAPARPAHLLPPAGYGVTWSTCTHFVEGDAKIRNNSRVVNVRSDGTVPIQRVEPVSDPKENFRRVVVAKAPNQLLGGEGLFRDPGAVAPTSPAALTRTLSVPGSGGGDSPRKVSFVKLGQVVETQEEDGNIVQWVIGSDQLGEPVKNDVTGKLEYQDTCFRSANAAGKDSLGYITPGSELAASCLVETLNAGYNAYTEDYGYLPLMNYANRIVPTANNPATRPLSEYYATYLGFDGVNYNYTGYGAALNDINGAERDQSTNYYGFDIYCHVIVSNGLEVPGAKRPATKSLPAPGVVNGKSLNVWRPVNPNVDIANDGEPGASDPVEPAPAPAEAPVDAADAIVPM